MTVSGVNGEAHTSKQNKGQKLTSINILVKRNKFSDFAENLHCVSNIWKTPLSKQQTQKNAIDVN